MTAAGRRESLRALAASDIENMPGRPVGQVVAEPACDEFLPDDIAEPAEPLPPPRLTCREVAVHDSIVAEQVHDHDGGFSAVIMHLFRGGVFMAGHPLIRC
ncbi:hypothetical protein GCM10009780_19660 [Actinomadura alba]